MGESAAGGTATSADNLITDGAHSAHASHASTNVVHDAVGGGGHSGHGVPDTSHSSSDAAHGSHPGGEPSHHPEPDGAPGHDHTENVSDGMSHDGTAAHEGGSPTMSGDDPVHMANGRDYGSRGSCRARTRRNGSKSAVEKFERCTRTRRALLLDEGGALDRPTRDMTSLRLAQDVRKWLTAHGWSPGRDIGEEVEELILARVRDSERQGVPLSPDPPALHVVHTYGRLRLPQPNTPGVAWVMEPTVG